VGNEKNKLILVLYAVISATFIYEYKSGLLVYYTDHKVQFICVTNMSCLCFWVLSISVFSAWYPDTHNIETHGFLLASKIMDTFSLANRWQLTPVRINQCQVYLNLCWRNQCFCAYLGNNSILNAHSTVNN